MRQIFLDTETTGLSPASGDRVIEIGCVEIFNRKPTGQTQHFYLNPERPNSEEAFKVHGLSDEFLASQPLFADVVDEFLAFVQGVEVIIHNAPFDVGFLNAELERLGRPKLTDIVGKVTDTLAMAKDLFPGKSNSLDALCRRFEVDNSNRTLHGALLDAGLLAEVYMGLTRGQDSLVMDMQGEGAEGAGIVVDLRNMQLMVLQANAEELAQHEGVLTQIDKASKGKTIWRQTPPPSA